MSHFGSSQQQPFSDLPEAASPAVLQRKNRFLFEQK